MSVLRNFARAGPWPQFCARSRLFPLLHGPNLVRGMHTNTPFFRRRSLSTLTVLVFCGATAYGIYNLYESFSIWPSELRSDLRSGIKAQHKGDFFRSELYLLRAWNTCRTIPLTRFGPDPWLKVSGIACKLGEVLEGKHQLEQAYDIYAECFARMTSKDERLSVTERQRAIGVAMHLAELADTLGKWDEEEKLLDWSVQECDTLMKKSLPKGPDSATPRSSDTDLILPNWIYAENLEAALEAAASFYAKKGNTRRAIRIYGMTAELMLTSRSLRPSDQRVKRKCRYALVCANWGSLLIDHKPSPENLEGIRKGNLVLLDAIESLRGDLTTPEAECERVWTTLLFNYGAVLEMQNKHEEARKYFERTRTHAQSVGIPEGVREAEVALARLSNHECTNDQIQR